MEQFNTLSLEARIKRGLCVLYAILMVLIGIVTAGAFVVAGEPLLYGAVAGLLNGIILTGIIVMTAGVLLRSYWQRTRGYPFAHGDVVRVTRGDCAGATGRIVGVAQGEWCYEVEVDGNDEQRDRVWVIASSIRRAADESGES